MADQVVADQYGYGFWWWWVIIIVIIVFFCSFCFGGFYY